VKLRCRATSLDTGKLKALLETLVIVLIGDWILIRGCANADTGPEHAVKRTALYRSWEC
jgi:hypothetical protein